MLEVNVERIMEAIDMIYTTCIKRVTFIVKLVVHIKKHGIVNSPFLPFAMDVKNDVTIVVHSDVRVNFKYIISIRVISIFKYM